MSSLDAILHEAWQRRWLRPDWQRWMRPDAHRFAPPGIEAKDAQAAPVADAAFAAELNRLRAQQDSLRRMLAGVQFELALRRLRRKYSPDQPRVPAGSREGGQWTDGGGTGAGKRPGSSASGDIVSKPAALRRRPPPAAFPDATPAQLARLAVAEARAEAAARHVRELDPNWKPSGSIRSGVEGAIREANDRANEAQSRFDQLRTSIGGNFGPPLEPAAPRSSDLTGAELIKAYRLVNNMPNLLGESDWPLDRGTVAVANINGSITFGVNSSAPGYTDADFRIARSWRDRLVDTNPELLKTNNLGYAPNDAFFHAESTLLLRAAAANGGTLKGRVVDIQLDKDVCAASCEVVLPKLAEELGAPAVSFTNIYSGARWITENGIWTLRGRR